MAASRYQHTPLSTPASIRLFRLTPQSPLNKAGVIKGWLGHYNINSCPPYLALSYAWGDATRKVLIECDGKSLLVTQNCFDFLVELAQDATEHLLWIDAICIDQMDIDERNQQVSMMERIYTGAGQVTIWLGHADPASEAAMSLLSKLVSTGLTGNEVSELLDRQADSPYGPLKRGLIDSLLRREWFRRTWTIQEAVLAPKGLVWLRCGSTRIPFESLLDQVRSLVEGLIDDDDYCRDGIIPLSRTVAPLQYLRANLDRADCGSKVLFRLSELLQIISGREATDARDKVFGMYSVFRRLGWNVPKPDYRKSVDQVYTGITRCAIEIDRDLNIIEAAGKVAETAGLPSWVPDYSNPCFPMGLTWADGISASGNSVLHYSFSPDGRRLTVKIQIVDTIQSCGPSIDVYTSVHLNGNARASELATIRAWTKLAYSLEQYANADELPEQQFAYTIYSIGRTDRSSAKALELYQCLKKILEDDDHDLTYEVIEQSIDAIKENSCTVFATTQAGRMCMVPARALSSDMIVAVAGCLRPFVVRPNGDAWTFVGIAYVHGIMGGEAWNEGAEPQSFTFV